MSTKSKERVDREKILYYYNLGFKLTWIEIITGYSYVTIHNCCKEVPLPDFKPLDEKKKELILNLIKDKIFSITFLAEVTGCSGDLIVEYIFELINSGEVDINFLDAN